jgi:hypothetical protein
MARQREPKILSGPTNRKTPARMATFLQLNTRSSFDFTHRLWSRTNGKGKNMMDCGGVAAGPGTTGRWLPMWTSTSGACQLVSRNRNALRRSWTLAQAIGQELTGRSAILDGEIVRPGPPGAGLAHTSFNVASRWGPR